ncbi:tRNA pseudouridine synthase D [Verticillium dahliae VdLs.17]|uniref:tRNA pseudouridine synthase D n=1 Tax=Verticillium dahliae (strain VdLs.17 / ATCC MYA-4575 / FGSC 10137) TaxID=498257 RepID=G2XHR8_VERDV|nr:tRNA pseudouridine synthase D [Verticillium dahliae VdLs.17]EGY19362.1 tRNA pseudouridine synthase D [Verticillium dahliae VdLs.17]
MAATHKPQIGAHGVRLNRGLGITERIAPKMETWTGETRVRFTDFQVNEISKDGTVVHLKETKLVELPAKSAAATTSENPKSQDATEASGVAQAPQGAEEPRGNGTAPQGAEEPHGNGTRQNGAAPPDPPAPEIPEPAAADIQAITDLASAEFAESLVAIYQAAAAKKTIPPPARSPPLEDKEQRGQLHQLVRRVFHSLIDTTTDNSDPSLAGAIIVASGRPPRPSKAYNQANRMKTGNNRRSAKGKVKAEGEGEYLHFTLYKENRDTMDAIHQLARAGRAKPQHFAFAGTKDRRAATAQRCSVRWLKAENLHGVQARVHGLVTGDYRYERHPLHLGGLQGNEFVITLKKCRLADPASEALPPAAREAAIRRAAETALESMASRGWLNYFGHQRFGTYAVGTHDVGRLILQEDFAGAVDAILAYRPEVAQRAVRRRGPGRGAPSATSSTRHRVCMLFQTGDGAAADDALHYLPRRFTAEGAVMRHLGRNPASRRDFHGALNAIPRQLRNMYLHAYQSYVWNHAASRRWALHGDAVVEGDLVVVDAAPKPDTSVTDPELARAQQPDGQTTSNSPNDNDDDEPDEPTAARALTAEEAASGRHTIHDVVLPSPGHAVLYPPNALGAFYASFMARPENGGLDPHSMARRHRDFSLPGTYRRLTARFLGAPAVEVRRYRDEEEQMHPTDLDRVRAAQAVEAQEAAAGRKRKWEAEQAQAQEQTQEQEQGPEGKKAKVEGQDDVVMGEAAEAVGASADAGNGASAVTAEAAKTAVSDEEKTKVAVIVKFQLGKSAYATVALRELMGEEDAGEQQTQETSA